MSNVINILGLSIFILCYVFLPHPAPSLPHDMLRIVFVCARARRIIFRNVTCYFHSRAYIRLKSSSKLRTTATRRQIPHKHINPAHNNRRAGNVDGGINGTNTRQMVSLSVRACIRLERLFFFLWKYVLLCAVECGDDGVCTR